MSSDADSSSSNISAPSRLPTYPNPRTQAPHPRSSSVKGGKGKGKGKGVEAFAEGPHPQPSESPRIPIQTPAPHADELALVSLLIGEVRRNPTAKVWIEVGNAQLAVSNGFALTMLLAGKAHVETERLLFEQRNSRRTAFELRGRGRLSKEEQESVDAVFVEDA